MRVDSFKYLPRSFAPLYATAVPLDGEGDAVWAAFAPRLADANVTLLTSAGLSVHGDTPFDVERERREPTWGDPSWRVVPNNLPSPPPLVMSHLHVNDADIVADRNVALPVDVLADLVRDGAVGSSTASHISVMGYQEAGLRVWREATAPAIVDLLEREGSNGVVLAPV